MPTLQKMLVPRSTRPGGSCLVLLAVLAGLTGCASEEIPKYGDPARVAGGAGGGGSGAGGSGAGGSTCEVDASCAVSFTDDIFPVLDGKAGCAGTSGCHADGKGSLTLLAGDADSYYDGLTAYQINNAPAVGKYIVPCDPAASFLPCNLKVSDGANPHTACGSTMPLVATNAPTLEELQDIEDWIACGAPKN